MITLCSNVSIYLAFIAISYIQPLKNISAFFLFFKNRFCFNLAPQLLTIPKHSFVSKDSSIRSPYPRLYLFPSSLTAHRSTLDRGRSPDKTTQLVSQIRRHPSVAELLNKRSKLRADPVVTGLLSHTGPKRTSDVLGGSSSRQASYDPLDGVLLAPVSSRYYFQDAWPRRPPSQAGV